MHHQKSWPIASGSSDVSASVSSPAPPLRYEARGGYRADPPSGETPRQSRVPSYLLPYCLYYKTGRSETDRPGIHPNRNGCASIFSLKDEPEGIERSEMP